MAGREVSDYAVRAGFGQKTQLHAVGDGAEWIASQVEDQFGAKGYYLVDFFMSANIYPPPPRPYIPKLKQPQTRWMPKRPT
jgi:hypothetical protein